MLAKEDSLDRLWRVSLAFALGVVLFNLAGSLAARFLEFEYAPLAAVSWLIYLAAGWVTTSWSCQARAASGRMAGRLPRAASCSLTLALGVHHR